MITIEDSIVKGLLFSDEYSRSVYPYLDEMFFEGGYKHIFQTYKELFDEYNNIPNVEALCVTLQKKNINESEFEDVVQIISNVSDGEELPDIKWLIKESEEFCRDKAVYNAIYRSINILDGTDEKLDKNIIPELLESAISISFDTSIGMDYYDDAENRYEKYTSEDARIKYPLEALNFLSNGGHKRKAISCALASTNVGKSAIMAYLAAEMLKAGHNVLYISLEMAEEDVYQRIDANILDVKTDDLKGMKRDDFVSKVQSLKTKTQGRLIVKEYPTGSAHAGHFRHLFNELRQKKKFEADFVFIDYINICASSRLKSMAGVNSYSYIKAIAEELRGLAMEFDIAMMTATQVNREGTKDQKNVDMTSTSESFGLPATMDFMFAMSTDEVLQDNGQQLLTGLKSRWGNKSKWKPQLVNIDFDKMRYTDAGNPREVVEKVGQNKPDNGANPQAKKRSVTSMKKSVDDIDWS